MVKNFRSKTLWNSSHLNVMMLGRVNYSLLSEHAFSCLMISQNIRTRLNNRHMHLPRWFTYLNYEIKSVVVDGNVLEEIWISSNLRKEKTIIFMQTFALKLSIAFKMAYSYSFRLGGNLDFHKKSFIRSTSGQKRVKFVVCIFYTVTNFLTVKLSLI